MLNAYEARNINKEHKIFEIDNSQWINTLEKEIINAIIYADSNETFRLSMPLTRQGREYLLDKGYSIQYMENAPNILTGVSW